MSEGLEGDGGGGGVLAEVGGLDVWDVVVLEDLRVLHRRLL